MSAPPHDPAPVEVDALRTLEDVHDAIERIEALAFVVAEALQDVRFVAVDDGARIANRRFTRLVGLLADQCEDARIGAGEEIDRLTRARAVEVADPSPRRRVGRR